jgi:hypothetical protein
MRAPLAVPGLLLLLSACLAQDKRAETGPPGSIDFSRQVRPILATKCFDCHGPDSMARRADLRLDVESSARRVIMSGQPEASLLYQKISSGDSDARMPPMASNKTLSPEQIELIRRWIAEGARWGDHWAFILPQRPAVPSAMDGTAKNAIDPFVLAQLAGVGLSPSPEADKVTLIRRATLDLWGLPPTPDEVDAFLADGSDTAYESLVDRLLASPRFGEVMARDWLDAARYGDSDGYHADQERFMWPWRDWVIDAFNSGEPYYQFLVEQIAGDLLSGASDTQKVATGFNRNHEISIEGGIIDAQYRAEYVADRVRTLGTAIMGVTIGCARCHEHKYDPFPQSDFYSLADCFNQIPEAGNGGENGYAPTLSAPSPIQRKNADAIDQRKKQLDASIDPARASAEEAAWEQSAKTMAPVEWTVLTPASANSAGGQTLDIGDDGTVKASGDAPDIDTYELTFSLPIPSIADIRAMKLAIDTGRAGDQSFGVTEVDAFIESDAIRTPIAWLDAIADDEAMGFEAIRAIDHLGRSSWTTMQKGGIHTLLLLPAQPITTAGGSILRIRIAQQQGGTTVIGAMRVLVSSDPLSALPDRLASVLATPFEVRSDAEQSALVDWFLIEAEGADLGRAKRETFLLERKRALLLESPAVMVMDDSAHHDTFVLIRGEYDLQGDRVSCAVPKVLGAIPDGFPANRLGVAQWLVAPTNPLTARVVVNRVWQLLFENGIVRTPDDFGSQGEFPTHPDLLDWLADEFVSSGWDLKHIVRLIATSATYRQSSIASADMLTADPENRWLARGPRGRLPAETIRDQALYASGLLNEDMGGPGAFPYQPPGLWESLNDNNGTFIHYRTDHGERLYRRSIYTFWKRSLPSPPMSIFDAPTRELAQVQRAPTNTPLQSLVLLDETEFVEAARKLAERMMKEGGASDEERITYGFRRLLTRKPRPEELAVLVSTYRDQLADFRSMPSAAVRFLSAGDSARDSSAGIPEHAAMTLVARILLNLTESITKE